MHRTALTVIALALLLPLYAHAKGPRSYDAGRIGVTRAALAKDLNDRGVYPPNVRMQYKASDFRVSTKVDKAHGADGHQHIVGHVPRLVKWSYPAIRVSGTADSDTIVGGDGRATTVSNVQLNPLPWSAPRP